MRGDDRLPQSAGRFLGGPGIIFCLMLLIAGAGGLVYLEATGQLRGLLSGGGADLAMNPMPAGGSSPAPRNATAGDPPLQSMAPLDADTPQSTAALQNNAAAMQPTQWPALNPADLLARLKPDPALALTEGGFDLPPWQRLARPAELARSQTAAAALVTGLGLNKAVTAAAIAELPPEISLSFSPYAADLGGWIKAARALGHEALVDLPMEPGNPQDDPGPLGLMTGLNAAENGRRIAAVTASGAGAIGVASALGGKFLRDETALQPVMQEFNRQGLAFIETGTDPQSQGPASAAAAKTPYLKAGLQIDAVVGRAEIERQLGAAIKLARSQGRALIVAGPYPISIAALIAFVKSLPDQGIVLVPASALIEP